MIFECHQQCDACYNCLHRGKCHWDSARKCMVRAEKESCSTCKYLSTSHVTIESEERHQYCQRNAIFIPCRVKSDYFCNEWSGSQ